MWALQILCDADLAEDDFDLDLEDDAAELDADAGADPVSSTLFTFTFCASEIEPKNVYGSCTCAHYCGGLLKNQKRPTKSRSRTEPRLWTLLTN